MATPSLIGREAALARLAALVDEHGLVTVVGPPGMGKTRLATELLRGREGWSCDLAAATTEEMVHDAVAGSLGVVLGGDPNAAIARRLSSAGARTLVLDNFEQLADRAAALLTPWREAAPALRIVVTSRERLRLGGEVVFELAPLSAREGVELLVERLRRSDPEYRPSAEERGELADIAAALDGIPLALELAAAPLEALGPSALKARLEERLSLLSRNRRDADARQATLRRAIDDSWRLLAPEAAEALARCAVFGGSFGLSAADAVLQGGALTALQDLRDRSLVWQPRRGRFALYQSIRVFASERLAERDDCEATMQRHADHYLAIAETHLAQFDATGELHEVLSLERDNLLAVLERAAQTGRAEMAQRAVLALGPVWKTRGPARRHLDWLDRVLAMDPPAPERLWLDRAIARRTVGESNAALGDLMRVRQSDDARLPVLALKELGLTHHLRREIEPARRWYEEALAAAEGDRRLQAICGGNLGALDHDVGRFEAAAEAYGRALDLLREVGDRRLESIFLCNAAVLAQEEGRLGAARSGYLRALDLSREVGDRRFEAITRGNLGVLEHEEGNLGAAETCHAEALASLVSYGDLHSEALARARLGAVQASDGRPDEAQRVFDEAERSVVGRDPVATALVRLFRAFADVHGDDETQAARRLEAAQRGEEGRPALSEVSDDARLALRLLARSLSSLDAPKLEVGPEARWFVVPGGERQSLENHAAGRHILAALVEQRMSNPDVLMTGDALFEAGWPGVNIDARSAKNRLHVALAKLRKLGLKPFLLREPDGYRLDPKTPIVRAPE